MKKRLLSVFLALTFVLSQMTVVTRADEQKKFSNLVLFVQFSDTAGNFMNEDNVNSAKKYYWDTSYQKSLVSYVDTISYGQLHIETYLPQYDSVNNTIQPIVLENSMSYYANESAGDYLAQKESLDAAKAIIPSSMNLDLNGDGSIDNVTFIFAGDNEERSSFFYPHKGFFDNPGYTINGKSMGVVNVLMADSIFPQRQDGFLVFGNPGTISHEFLHSLGYPDLYHESDGGVPVGTWDLMATSSIYMQWPLAYLRSKVSGWLNISEITSSQKGVTLQPATSSSGNRAFILKTDINDSEFFVVEYRQQAEKYSDQLDEKIPGSGLIVYRVNTTVEQLSNHYGQDGIYVFRQGEETVTSDDATKLYQTSFLSAESGRTTYGSSDLTATISDNALVYSNGQNSGIVLKNIGSCSDTISFDVEFTDTSNVGLWKNLGGSYFGEDKDNVQGIDLYDNNGVVTALIENSGSGADSLTLYSYQSNQWKAITSSITDSLGNGSLTYLNGIPYVLYKNSNNYQLKLSYYQNNQWNVLKNDFSTNQCLDAKIISLEDRLLVAYDDGPSADISNNHSIVITEYKDGSWKEIYRGGKGTYAGFDLIRQGNVAYVSCRNANSRNQITVLKVEDTTVTTLAAPDKGYDTALFFHDGTSLYLLGSSDYTDAKTYLYQYQEDVSIKFVSETPVPVNHSSSTSYSIYNGVPIVQVTDQSNPVSTSVYRYENKTWTQEGLQIASVLASDTDMVMMGNQCYVGAVIENRAYVKVKDIVVNNGTTPTGKSVTGVVVSPIKMDYKIGESFSSDDIVVMANYSDFTEEELNYNTEYQVTGFDTATVGEKTVTVTYEGFTDYYKINVTEGEPTPTPTLSSIEMKTSPSKTSYIAGQSLNVSGGSINAKYSDGSSITIPLTSSMVSGYNSSKTGTQSLNVYYKGKTTSFNVTVSAKVVSSISLTSKPSKTSYIAGQGLDVSGGVISAKYNDGSSNSVILTSSMVSGFNSSKTGTQSLTVNYEGKTTSFNVTVSAKAVTSISLTSKPSKTSYITGQSLNVSGGVISAKYNDGSSKSVTLTASMVSGYTSSKTGTQSLTVNYEGKTTSFNVTVSAKAVTSISLTTKPSKTSYTAGQSLNVSGGVITVRYNDGTSENISITASMVSGYNPSNTGTQTVTVNYGGKSTSFTVTVSPKPVETQEMYRLYNSNSGEHFYTASVAERNFLKEVGWSYEGVGWIAPVSGDPVYRLYNSHAGDHHYTTSAYERDVLVSVGWRYEGIGWYSDPNQKSPLYREYNPHADTGTHNYTLSRAEHNWLVSLGWRDEGIGWYGS